MRTLVVGRGGLIAVATTLLTWVPLDAQDRKSPDSQVVEVRSYNLKAGTRARFHQLFEREALPMLRRWKVDVVAYGPSLHDNDSFYLMRGFPGVEERQRSEDAFYGSEEWRKGPRDAALADIDSYTTIVIRVDEPTLRGLRGTGQRPAAMKEQGMQTQILRPGEGPAASASDLTTLLELNQDYIRSVLASDITRFREILSDDFLCSNPDGSLVDRARFLEQTAKPVQISNLEVHDVNVRLMGDVAIVHARTTYKTRDGRDGSGRYTDVWARRDGRWLAVSAHVTRN